MSDIEFMEIEVRDDRHTDHETVHVETVYDNPVEVTEWWYCRTCKENFIGYGVELAWDEDEI